MTGRRVLTVTGHRPERCGGYSKSAEAKLVTVVEKSFDELQPTGLIVGMALGWDMTVAVVCVDRGIPFVAAVPFTDQDFLWPVRTKEIYRRLLNCAAKVVHVNTGCYTPQKMIERNVWMIERAPELLALYDHSPNGGTHNAIAYAQRKDKVIWNAWGIYEGKTDRLERVRTRV